MLRASSSTVGILIFKTLGALAGFSTAVLLAQSYGLASLAYFGLGSTYSAIVGVVAGFGAPVLLMKAAGIEEPRRPPFSVSWAASWTVVAGGLCLLVPPYLVLLRRDVNPLAFYFSGAVVLLVVLQVSVPVRTRQGHFLSNSLIVDAVRPSLLPLSLLAMLAIDRSGKSPASLETVSTVAGGLSVVLAVYICLRLGMPLPRDFRLAFSGNGGGELTVPGTLRQGMTVVVVGVLTILVAQVDRLYLRQIVSVEELGLYVAAQAVATIVAYLIQSLTVQMVPSVISALESGALEQISRLQRRYASAAVGGVAALAVLILTLGENLDELFGTEHGRIVPIALTLLAGHLVSLPFGFGPTLLLYWGPAARRVLIGVLAVSSATSVLIGAPLAFLYGVEGAAVGAAIGVLASRLLAYLYFRRMGLRIGVV